MSDDVTDVLVVGGGPTGLVTANALGQLGVNGVVVEQEPGVAELPRAVSVDDEAMRLMQSLGLLEQARRVVLPGTGTKYYGARGQLLAYARGPERPRYGHPVKNPMDHPEFQRMLLDGLGRFGNLEVRHNTRLDSFDQDDDGVVALVSDGDRVDTIRCRYLVGADGGRSVVRTLLGLEPMAGLAFEERWLVLDTANDPHDERFAMHHGDPARPRVVIAGRDGRCRYEFLLHDHEQPDDERVLALAMELVAPYRRLDPADVVRCTVYKFYALVADEFSSGRAFLAGDAAHMMPPFAGQGLNTGLRDAANLSWKLAAVLQGRAGPELLSTYTIERRPHVSATVRLSMRMGAVMMTRSRARARARDLAFAAAGRLPVVSRFFREMRFKPAAAYGDGLLVAEPNGSGAAGAMLVQPRVLDPEGELVWLDDVIGPGFGLLAVGLPPDAFDRLASPMWGRLGVTRVHVGLGDRFPRRFAQASVADADGLLADQLGDLEGQFVLVRPDRFIAGAFAPRDEHRFAERLGRILGTPARERADAQVGIGL